MKCEYCDTDFAGADESCLSWVPHGKDHIRLACPTCKPTPTTTFSLDASAPGSRGTDFVQQSRNNLWWPAPKAVNKMTRTEVVSELRKFRNAWQQQTKENQNLSNDFIKKETITSLRKRLRHYYSDASYKNSLDWPSRNFTQKKTPKKRKRKSSTPKSLKRSSRKKYKCKLKKKTK